jgi:choline dehydrogenase
MENQVCEAFRLAAIAAGVPPTTDFNGPDQEGVGYYQLTNQKGRRSSTAVAYLKPIKQRHNLSIITGAAAERVVLSGRKATGIDYRRNGLEMRAVARREVILSGGAIGSPQLLQVSGIGPAAVLKAAGVDVVHDLAGVGDNLQDHYQARMMYEMAAEGSLNDVWHSRWLQFTAGLNYVVRRQGILTIGAGVVGAFTKSTPDLDEPDIQFHFIPLSGDGPGKGLHAYP